MTAIQPRDPIQAAANAGDGRDAAFSASGDVYRNQFARVVGSIRRIRDSGKEQRAAVLGPGWSAYWRTCIERIDEIQWWAPHRDDALILAAGVCDHDGDLLRQSFGAKESHPLAIERPADGG